MKSCKHVQTFFLSFFLFFFLRGTNIQNPVNATREGIWIIWITSRYALMLIDRLLSQQQHASLIDLVRGICNTCNIEHSRNETIGRSIFNYPRHNYPALHSTNSFQRDRYTYIGRGEVCSLFNEGKKWNSRQEDAFPRRFNRRVINSRRINGNNEKPVWNLYIGVFTVRYSWFLIFLDSQCVKISASFWRV